MTIAWWVFGCITAWFLGRIGGSLWLLRRDRQPEVHLTVSSVVGMRIGNVLRVDGKLWRVEKVSYTQLNCRRLTPEEVLLGRILWLLKGGRR